MPDTILHRDFSAGWCPSDDKVNGRPNCLLQMNNVELDQNGALQLIGGTQLLNSAYPASAYEIFSRFMHGIRYDYLALNNGTVYRNSAQIISGGDNKNTAFGTAFDFTLICSGTQRFKDNSLSLISLGVKPATAPITITQDLAYAPQSRIGNLFVATVLPVGTSAAPIGGNQYLQITTNSSGQAVLQTYDSAAPTAYSDCSQLGGLVGYGFATDDDYVIINGYTPDPFGLSIQFDAMLKPGNPAGDPVTDSYTYTVRDVSKTAKFDAISGVFTIRIQRVDFQRTGGDALDWSKVYGFRLTINTNKKATSIINIWTAIMGEENFVIRGGSNAQFGTYQYVQVNVNNTGSYLAKSIMGPESVPVTLDGTTALLTFQDPTTIDPQVNEVWIFRKGGNLGGTYYRVAVRKPPFTPNQLYDPMGDQDALTLNITIDINLISTSEIPENILDIIGPIQGRWYYFTTNFMYPSEINDPDLVNPGIALRTCGSSSELFLWARTVSASVIIVGTSVDCYLLTGTFASFPDGTIDIYYQSLGVKFPPVSYNAMAYGGAVYYYASDGWRLLLPTSFGSTYANQNNQLLVAPNTDRIYQGENCYGYTPPISFGFPGSTRFPVTIAKNKLWCFITGGDRCEVYDFVRQYWRVIDYKLGDVSACTTTQDGRILAFYQKDNRLREIDIAFNKFIDGSGKQDFRLLFPYKDNGLPRQRKDTYTFKSRCYTGSSGAININIVNEQGIFIPQKQISSNLSTTEAYTDLSQASLSIPVFPKSYQVALTGSCDDLIIEDWSIDYDVRPIPLTFLRLYPSNLGSATKKRVRTWPLVIDTLGNNVIFTPNVDNVDQASSTFNSDYKKTHFHYFTTDVFGIDYGGTLYDPNGLMEVWSTGLEGTAGGLSGDIVQNLPMAHEYDQVGPIEIFRFGKIVRMALRTQSNGTPIPFRIFIGDTNIWSGQFDVKPGVEDEYIVDLPKGVSGAILRVELGPCPFTFSRYFMKFQVMISGGQQDTELAWITVPGISQALAQGI